MTTVPQPEQGPLKVDAAFVRSNFYRVIHADGAFGGVSPNRNIRMAVYSEALRIPDVISYDFSPSTGGAGTLTETGRTPELNSTDTMRELEVDIVMTLRVARSIRDWLDGKIREFEVVGEADDDSD